MSLLHPTCWGGAGERVRGEPHRVGGTGTSLEAEEASSASDYGRLPGGLKVAAWLGRAGETRFSAAALIPQEPLVGVGWGDENKGHRSISLPAVCLGFQPEVCARPSAGLAAVEGPRLLWTATGAKPTRAPPCRLLFLG